MRNRELSLTIKVDTAPGASHLCVYSHANDVVNELPYSLRQAVPVLMTVAASRGERASLESQSRCRCPNEDFVQ